jgi:capsular polysaccharide transport system permease protein
VVLSGYTMLTLWRHIVSRFVHSFRHNSGLMFHRNVRPLDTLFARFILETLGCLISFFVSYTALYLLDMIDPIADIFILVSAWFLLSMFAFSVALLLAALGELWEPAEKFIQPLMYITIPLTGAFNMLSWIPPEYHNAMLYSPMLNTVEMFRQGLIGESVQTYWYPEYVLSVSLFLTVAGLILMMKAQAHIRIE